MAKVLMKGNEAIGEAAVRAGCRFFFGYPITPQSEVPEYLCKRLPEVGGAFVQAESEVAASNMILGASGVGVRVLTTSSSPGISLMSEGLSYIACCELPVVLVNVVRSGPGLGGILPSQSDYFQATKGGGHGDYRLLVLAPASVQEAVALVVLAFELADRYRNPVMVMADGMIGQMMEPVDFSGYPLPGPEHKQPEKPWALTGTGSRGRTGRNIVNSLYLDPISCNEVNLRLKRKYDLAAQQEKRWEEVFADEEVDLLVVSYGSMARICRTAIDRLRAQGRRVSLLRPITLWPFPDEAVRHAALRARRVLSVEMSMGQMVEDVRLAVSGARPVDFFGMAGGRVPTVEEVQGAVVKLIEA
ncbi:MAG: 3-methyl-2-oxobutanoate dehydrogenase subunit VorB [Deltaproteobacteria bacterium]|nr:3-methyl-2-oxobutanoate dehydrogenase subunit VorB [Deltaproteobacteria bacterium]